jgi:hypothetical protein
LYAPQLSFSFWYPDFVRRDLDIARFRKEERSNGNPG